MPLNWFKNFALVKKDGAVQSAIDAIVRFDPKGASEAELRTMEERLDQIGSRVAAARVDYDREKGEADEYRGRYDKRLAAIQILKGNVDAEQDPTKKQSLTASLTKFVDETRELKDQVRLEIDDEEKAKALLDQLKEAYETAANKLQGAKKDLERARRDMEGAEQRKETAETRAQAAREAAGLANAASGVNVALEAMKGAADRSRAEAAVLDDKAKLLTPSDLVREDANVAAAMRQAEGSKPKPSLDDEIADLKL